VRAAVVESPDRPPVYGDVELPPAAPGQVVVAMEASALSPRTRSGASGSHYSSRPGQPPMVAGIDGVGTLPDGQRVYVLALDGPMGTLAERCVVDADRCVPLPDGADAQAIAAGMIPGISSWAALRLRARLQPGQRVLVLGATGVAGTLAVQVARALGAGRVVAAGRDPRRLAALRGRGADAVVSLVGEPDEVAAQLRHDAGDVDIVLDYLWGPVTEQALGAILTTGRDPDQALHWVEIGSMAGTSISLPSAALRSRDLRLVGSGQGSVPGRTLLGLLPELMAAFADGTLAVETTPAPLRDVEALWDASGDDGRRIVFTI
jgi:NADPH:quinone reductase-like Zn-dependent oxidoreductase